MDHIRLNKVEVRNSPINGSGVFAVAPICKGEIVIVWHPLKLLSLSDLQDYSATERHYIAPIDDESFLLMGEPERYVNHSCAPNTGMQGQTDIAIRNIEPGEEITGDYARDGTIVGFQCTCGSANCKGWVGPT